jgi:hypothetical protein
MMEYLSFRNSSFALKILFNNVNGKATVWHTPCFLKELDPESNPWFYLGVKMEREMGSKFLKKKKWLAPRF